MDTQLQQKKYKAPNLIGGALFFNTRLRRHLFDGRFARRLHLARCRKKNYPEEFVQGGVLSWRIPHGTTAAVEDIRLKLERNTYDTPPVGGQHN